MRNVLAIFSREMKSYFASPMGYFILAAFYLVTTVTFFIILAEQRMRPQGAMEAMQGAMMNTCFILLLVVPAITMRLFAEEKRSGTLEVLMTCPVKDSEVVLGKFFAAWCLLAIMVGMTLSHALVIEWCGNPYWPALLSGYFGLLLVGAAFIAMGLLTSAITRYQVVAAISCFAFILILWIMEWLGNVAANPLLKDVLKGLSIFQPFYDFVKGVVDVKHIVYYVSFVFYCLYLTVKSVENRKWK